jgi:hypothetical protein
MDLVMVSIIGNVQTMVKGWRSLELNLVGWSTRVLTKGGAEHPRLMQTYKGTSLGLTVKQRHGYTNIQGLTTMSTGSGS